MILVRTARLKVTAALALVLLSAACGGDSNEGAGTDSLDTGSGTSDSGGDLGPSDDVGTPPEDALSDANFEEDIPPDADAEETGGDAADADTTSGADTAEDATADSAEDATADSAGDADVPPSDPDTDAGMEDAVDDSGTTVPRGAIADYQICEDDLDCPNRSDFGSYGDCVTEIPLSRPDGEVTSVAVSDVFGLDPGLGVCGAACSDDPAACDDLWIRDDREVPYSCQLVYRGTAPYPGTPPEFPFDGDLNSDELVGGTPFGALCRPPFEVAGEVVSDFCAPCADASECGGGLCWSPTGGAVVDRGDGFGECLTPCEVGGTCPNGFNCEVFESGDYCAPVEGTCSACVDQDGDFRGDGFCGVLGDISEHDCDDSDPAAYYDADDPEHPFPDSCGAVDRNCNGLSDASEVVGNPAYSSLHCTSCDDPCTGRTASGNGDLICVGAPGATSCGATCDGGWETCEPTALCAVESSDESRRRYRDRDRDGFGHPTDYEFLCGAPLGDEYTASDNTDCDDGETEFGGTTYPGAPELCNGRDDDCDETTPDGVDDDTYTVGDACSAGESCGTFACDGGWVCEPYDDLGDLCESSALPAPVGVCAGTTWQCGDDGLGQVCAGPDPAADVDPYDGVDQNCDGWPGDESAYVFVRSRASAGDGSRERPLNSLDAAITMAAERELDVIIGGTVATGGEFVIGEQLSLRPGVNLLGGFDESFEPVDGVLSDDDRASIVRTRAVPVTGAHAVAVLGTNVPDVLIRNVQISFNDTPGSTSGIGHIGIYLWRSDGARLENVSVESPAGVNAAPLLPYGEAAPAGDAGIPSIAPNISPVASGFGGQGGLGGNPDTPLCPAGAIARITGPTSCGCWVSMPEPFDDIYLTSCSTVQGAVFPGSSGGTATPSRPSGAGGAARNPGSAGTGGLGGDSASPLGAGETPFVAVCGPGEQCPVFLAAGNPGSAGVHGAGGGGGGGGAGVYTYRGALGVQGGSGGAGGAGGSGGESGGSSFALLLVETELDADSTAALRAGDGGDGADGQAGQRGGNAGAGTPAPMPEIALTQAGSGGPGGAGGGGGGGGGGHGGSSACIARTAGLSVPVGLECVSHGSPGVSGAGGGAGSPGVPDAFSETTEGLAGEPGPPGLSGEAASIIDFETTLRE